MLDTQEHWEINKANTLEQLFNILNVIHKKCRNKDLVINKRYEELSAATDIIDPNKFPIFSLIERMSDNDYVSLWEYKPEYLENIAKEIGFQLEVKQSKVEHHEAGDGVFLKCTNPDQKILPGSLLGIVPGVLYSSYEPPIEDRQREDPRVEKNYLTLYDTTYLKYSDKLPYPIKFGYSLTECYENNEKLNALRGENLSIIEVPGEYFNPYAVGHKINHPPPDTSLNTLLLDIVIPYSFFPEYLLSYLPYVRFSSEKDAGLLKEYYHNNCFHGLAIIAVDEIYDGDELYCDYFDHQRYSMNFTPDWLVRPPPLSPYLTKYEYENNFSFLAKVIDSYLVSRQGDVYNQFLKKTSHDPDSQKLLRKTTAIQDRIQAKKNKEKATN